MKRLISKLKRNKKYQENSETMRKEEKLRAMTYELVVNGYVCLLDTHSNVMQLFDKAMNGSEEDFKKIEALYSDLAFIRAYKTVEAKKKQWRNSMKFRKKPVVIEAVKYEDFDCVHKFCGNKAKGPSGYGFLEIETLEGIMKANKGDFIIKGVNGEFYPCKPDIFNKTYEKV